MFNPASGGNGADAPVKALAVFNSKLVVGGNFNYYRNESHSGYVVTQANGTIDESFSVRAFPSFTADAFTASVHALAVVGTDLFMAGKAGDFFNFNTWGVVARISATSFPNSDVSFASAAAASYTGVVNSLAATATGIFVGGEFASLRNGEKAEGLAKVLANGTLDPEFHLPGASGFQNAMGNSRVMAILVQNDSIYVGGTFTRYNDLPVNGIAKLNMNAQLDTVFSPTNNNATGVSISGFTNGERGAYALAADATHLYVGGNFDRYRGSQIAKYIARIELDTGTLDTTFSPQTGSNGVNHFSTPVVRSIVVANGDVYLGGDFISFKGAAANYVAKISPAGVLNSIFNPSSGANGANSTVSSLVVSGNHVFVGGSFSQYRSRVVRALVKVTTAGVVDASFNTEGSAPGYFETGVSSRVSTLAIVNNQLYVGGLITDFKGTVVRNLARSSLAGTLDNLFSASVQSLSGTNGIVHTVAACGANSVCVGGSFFAAGEYSSGSTAEISIADGKNQLGFISQNQ